MQVIVFEDAAVERLAPLTTVRPACDLTIGAHTLCQALAPIGAVQRVVRPHLARHLAAIADSRITLWGVPVVDTPEQPLLSRHGAVTVVINARVVPSRATVVAIRSLVEAGHRGIVRDGAAIAAAILHRSADGGSHDDRAMRRLVEDGVADGIESLDLEALDCSLELLREPHDPIVAHEWAIAGSLAMLIDSGRFSEIRPGLFAAEGATVAEQVVVRHGPVVVEAGAAIGPFVCIDGPAYIGRHARVNPHAWIRGATTIGDACRLGGEIEATVMEPYANKPHHGFLGHSHIGSWANIAAGTTTSNLKASYGTVRLKESGRTIDTGRQFLGALVGDLAKTAVNTSLPCGARIGVAATVGGSVPENVPPFQNQLVAGGGGITSADQAATVLERMMVRRGLAVLPADRDLLEAIG